MMGDEELDRAYELRKNGAFEEGRKYLLRSIEMGNADAMFELFYTYREGGWGFGPNERKSLEWLLKSCNAGSDVAAAFLEMPGLYACGEQTYKPYGEIVPVGVKTTESRDQSAKNFYAKIKEPFARGMFLARFYGKKGVEHRIIKSLTRAATSKSRTSTYAQYMLGRCYYLDDEYSMRGFTDHQLSIYWLKMAADNGFGPAQSRYCMMCNLLPSIELSLVKMTNVQILRNACQQGVSFAYNELKTALGGINDSSETSNRTEEAFWQVKTIEYRGRYRNVNTSSDDDETNVESSRTPELANLSRQISRMSIIILRRNSDNFAVNLSWMFSPHAPKTTMNRKNGERMSTERYIWIIRNELRQLYVYGGAKIWGRSLLSWMKWKHPCDRDHCHEVFTIPNHCARKAAIAILVLRRRGLFRLNKDVATLLARMIWESRTDPIIWLK